jgi:hypothetical protein
VDPSTAGLVTAIGTAVAGILTAAALVINAVRRTPKHARRYARVTSLLERTRDWLQTVGLWEEAPYGLREDIDEALDEQPDEKDDDHESR